ncbi:pyrroloquinoline quinone-dependent dehydrogenase [Stenotrophomonas sp. HITSZ_GD]|uniref:pyrroloquinoline quinone-dependent dehydrogenase n=1 Tax=Stenotrophomonas sp. HITSZ_GD TaxID=3037248 RepID=UPI00240CEAD6|nr:pyrroloquinoline quinone-dependent dehydrogenase [Stenotrophomonas sp. HITSZ_GD]MDG2524352.1 pyrroloquinoline quinone-dependent dehydrogenase [Stenotrophomonas sp. HITSZ_GD]
MDWHRTGARGALVVLALAAATGAANPGTQGDWAHYAGAPGGGQYSPLTQITADNVHRLRIAWSFRTGELGAGLPDPERRRFEANPLVIGGRMYLNTGTGIAFALDAASGRELWSHDAKVARDRAYSDPASRGVSFWRDPRAAPGAPCRERIVYGTLDARLIAVDAADGKPCAQFGSAGQIDLRQGVAIRSAPDARWQNYAVTSPPVIAEGVMVVGSSIGDNRASALEQGVVRGYDVRDGRELWRWDPVPRDPAQAAAQGWVPAQAATVGAANAWAPLSVDPALGLVYVPTGSASPDYFGGERTGDNRDANSLVALDLHTGRRVWAQQLVHHDLWDYDLASQPALATVQTAQGPREAVLQATKTGFLFAFDRRTGAPVFPISEVPVPASDVPGEHASPTQPMPEPALRLSRMTPVTPADAWGPTPGERRDCEAQIAQLRSEGIFTPPSVRGTIALPGWAGGVNWGGIAIDPQRQLAILPVTDLPMQVALIPREQFDWDDSAHYPGQEFNSMDGTAYGMRRGVLKSAKGTPCVAPPWGRMVAVDLRTRQVAWERPLGTLEETLPWLPLEAGLPILGGATATAGGVTFIGGSGDARLRALDTATGKTLWDAKLPAGGQATPSVYAVAGRQYVVIAAGGREGLGPMGDYVIAYALDGQGEEVVFQHGVAVRMAVLASAALLLLGGAVWGLRALWRRRRRR